MRALGTRTSPRPATTDGEHHGQVGVTPVHEIDAELRRRAFAMPRVEKRETLVSVGGAEALWIDEGIRLVRPDLIHEREFAHVHPDGSLHVTLSADRAEEAVMKGWGERPPHGHKARHEGRVLLFTPMTHEELEVVIDLVRESFVLIAGEVAEDSTRTAAADAPNA